MNMWNQTYEVDCEHVVCPNCTTDEKPVETRTEIKIPVKKEEIESTKTVMSERRSDCKEKARDGNAKCHGRSNE